MPTAQQPPRRTLSIAEALLPLAVLIGLLIAGATLLSLSGELLVAIILAAAATAGIIARRHGATWEDRKSVV